MLYDDGRFADRVREATGGRGVDVVYDAVGRTTLRDSFRATRVRGLVVNYGSVSGSLNDLDPIELGESGSLFLTRPRLADHLADAETVQRRADDVFAALSRRLAEHRHQCPLYARQRRRGACRNWRSAASWASRY